MNIGKLLGVVSPGLSATGLFGHGAQGVGQGVLGASSPLMALLLHHKNGGSGVPQTQPPAPVDPAAPAPAAPAPLMGGVAMPQSPLMGPITMPQAAAPAQGITDPKRQRLAQMLLSIGSSMGGGFGQPRY